MAVTSNSHLNSVSSNRPEGKHRQNVLVSLFVRRLWISRKYAPQEEPLLTSWPPGRSIRCDRTNTRSRGCFSRTLISEVVSRANNRKTCGGARASGRWVPAGRRKTSRSTSGCRSSS